MKDDRLLIAQFEDRIKRATDRYMIVSGSFLDMHQLRVLTDYMRGRRLPVDVVFYGGYDDAERRIPVILPDYATEEDLKELVKIVRVTAPRGSRRLTHRDYLGSILSLGINREVVGDIVVREERPGAGGGADIIVTSEMAEYIQMNYQRAGRTELSCVIMPIESLDRGVVRIETRNDTVPSLRLDAVVASAFNISRSKAADAIRGGIVSVNSLEASKIDMDISQGDKIVLKGRGKVVLAQVGGMSRKDRIRVTFNIYR